MKVVWLASYPKSGNTFIRMLLYAYELGGIQDSEDIERRIPDIHELLSQKKVLDTHDNQQRIVKTHFCLSDSHPYAEATSGYIYILRNPRDVLLSNARYLGVNGDKNDLRKFSITFINNYGVPHWRRLSMGSWPEHLASWLYSANKMPSIYIKYEDLRMDTANTLRRIVSFLGMVPEESKINQAVEHCAIEKARKLEIDDKRQGKKGIFDSPGNNLFIGEGRVAQTLNFIGEDVEALYQEKFGMFVQVFGY